MKFFILIILLFLGCESKNQTPERVIDPKIDNIQTLVSDHFDENDAYETTKYVSERWRIAGNKGFNESIYKVEEGLKKSGFVKESDNTKNAPLTYRIETRKMKRPTWEPLDASLKFSDGREILDFKTNRNMVAINSYSTALSGIEAEICYIKKGERKSAVEVRGKIVFAEGSVYRLFKEYVEKKGALGVIAYRLPKYLKPEINTNSIQFSRIPHNETKKSFGLLTSYKAKQLIEAELKKGSAKVKIKIDTNIYPSEELTVVANLRGSEKPDERFVFSAHVQEPGANDNATGVGTLLEMADVTAKLFKSKKIAPNRTITFLWGDEIVSTRRYIKEDTIRAKGIKWGMSLDMVGEDTKKTGGTFLIEKMPDPSAIWTRGNDKHSEWGGEVMKKSQMKPHYFNDFILNRMKDRASKTGWVVNTNPFEGGSDHTPFLQANIPGLLLWHFTDQFYHTDQDRIDKVSSKTLKNVGVGALTSALILAGSDNETPFFVLNEIKTAFEERIEAEFLLSKTEVEKGNDAFKEIDILETWTDWYIKSAESINDITNSEIKEKLRSEISMVTKQFKVATNNYISKLKK